MGPAAPNFVGNGVPFGAEVKKPKPNFDKAGQPPMASDTIIPLRAASRAVAQAKQTAFEQGIDGGALGPDFEGQYRG